jgi:hypothetical protein
MLSRFEVIEPRTQRFTSRWSDMKFWGVAGQETPQETDAWVCGKELSQNTLPNILRC